MNRSIIPWVRNKVSAEPRRSDPFSLLQKQMNELFDGFFNDSPFAGTHDLMSVSESRWFGNPRVDVTEADNEIQFTADMPGISEEDIKVTLDNDILTIETEKQEEKDEKEKHYHLSERRFGKFSRSFRLPDNTIKEEEIKATFKNGVLRISLPKTEPTNESTQREIPISTGD